MDFTKLKQILQEENEKPSISSAVLSVRGICHLSNIARDKISTLLVWLAGIGFSLIPIFFIQWKKSIIQKTDMTFLYFLDNEEIIFVCVTSAFILLTENILTHNAKGLIFLTSTLFTLLLMFFGLSLYYFLSDVNSATCDISMYVGFIGIVTLIWGFLYRLSLIIQEE